MSKKYLLVLFFIAAAGVLSYLFTRPDSTLQKDASDVEFSGQTVVVKISDEGFEPSALSIGKGDKVVFENIGTKPHWPASDFHPTHGIYPEFDPLKGIEPQTSWSFIFGKFGTWRYHDHLYPNLTGSVEVK